MSLRNDSIAVYCISRKIIKVNNIAAKINIRSHLAISMNLRKITTAHRTYAELRRSNISTRRGIIACACYKISISRTIFFKFSCRQAYCSLHIIVSPCLINCNSCARYAYGMVNCFRRIIIVASARQRGQIDIAGCKLVVFSNSNTSLAACLRFHNRAHPCRKTDIYIHILITHPGIILRRYSDLSALYAIILAASCA